MKGAQKLVRRAHRLQGMESMLHTQSIASGSTEESSSNLVVVNKVLKKTARVVKNDLIANPNVDEEDKEKLKVMASSPDDSLGNSDRDSDLRYSDVSGSMAVVDLPAVPDAVLSVYLERDEALSLAAEREAEISRQRELVKQEAEAKQLETARANQEAERANALARELAELRAQFSELSVLRHKKVKQDDGLSSP
jgi:hypothetical protein